MDGVIQPMIAATVAGMRHRHLGVFLRHQRVPRRISTYDRTVRVDQVLQRFVRLLALVGINVLQPGYYDEVKETSLFIPACLVVAAFLVVNIFVMRTLVNIKV